jgi:hypothetical protein
MDNISKILKKLIPQENLVHKYSEPSCPFIFSKEIDSWIDTMMSFLLEKFIPLMQERYKNREQRNEQFFSGNFRNKQQKNPSTS